MITPDLSEITRDIPHETAESYRNKGQEPLLIAYGCLLLERDTGDGYTYTVVNIATGKTMKLSRRLNPITTKNVVSLVEKIRKSPVSGRGRREVDRRFGEKISFEELQAVQETVFYDILANYGYTLRKKQIEFANHIMDVISRRQITLAEAEVGTGKTHAYLIAAILAKRGRANDFWNGFYYPEMRYVDIADMPIVISTSSIALQKAIVHDYIPEISRIFMKCGIIKTPVTAVIRKGKEHYLCERNLLAYIPFEHDKKVKSILEHLASSPETADIAEIDGLTKYVKQKICVPEHCSGGCSHLYNCRYLRFLERAQSTKIDIQVCNHNYILADTKRRGDGLKPLVPNYQCLIIDEAHKFLQAARQIYGTEFSNLTLGQLLEDVRDIYRRLNGTHKNIRVLAKKLADRSARLFSCLDSLAAQEATREVARHLRKIRDIADSMTISITSEQTEAGAERTRILRVLEKTTKTASKLSKTDDFICWLEKSATEMKLRAVPKDLGKILLNELWSRGLPIILTSGTLSAGTADSGERDFTHIKQTLGLCSAGNRLAQISKPSPFNMKKNAILYISENVPFPNNKNPQYINAVAEETERLIYASNGHAAVLFTSYDVLGRVYSLLKKRSLPFPMFRLEKSVTNTIEKFKKSGNGVLFASGSMWEGVDIPGDTLSMLIIVKLPFQIPNPISEYERTLYPDLLSYKNNFIVPDMLIKLRQGFGRLIRLESDTGVVAILDSRVNEKGKYRSRVLASLPKCITSSQMEDVREFIVSTKKPEYFH